MMSTLKYILTLVILIFIYGASYSQNLNTSDYIKKYNALAIKEMEKFKIPASIILAQGILESGNGNSRLAIKGKNHFGIKCHEGWDGKTIKWDDDSRRECFRKYNSVADSYRDHSEFLAYRKHYAPLFQLSMTDYKGWAVGLQKAGYATNNKYSTLLIRIIEDNNLQKFDNPALLANIDQDYVSVDNQNSSKSDNDFEPVNLTGYDRPLYTNNGVKFIFARSGDNFAGLAKELNIYTWQVYKYNELNKHDTLREGQMLYIEKKKRKASQDYHTVKPKESPYSISQLYGIQLKVLLRKNKLANGDYIYPGQQLKLR